jgi:hypothetical protein
MWLSKVGAKMLGLRSTIFIISLGMMFAGGVHAEDVLGVADKLVQQRLKYIYGSEDLAKGGLDCSGFVQIVFRAASGVDLPNEADKQLAFLREHGEVWDSTSGWTPLTLQPGDLIFFAGPYELPRSSLISHVMIYCGHNIMVGAQGHGRRIDGLFSGVGYYPFPLREPKGIWGESGERFVGNRRVFAYGRLKGLMIGTLPEAIAKHGAPVSAPATAQTSVLVSISPFD